MASVDAGQYSLSSDEKVEFECNPCKDDGLVRQAEYFCPECSEYFCSSCESSSHRRLKATKSHKLLPASEATKTVAQKTAKLPIMACNCNRERSVEFVCDEHKCIVCSECKVINHRKCKTTTVAEKSKSVTQNTISASVKKINSLGDKAKQLCDEHNETLEASIVNKLQCKNDICQVRDQLMYFVESLAQKALDEVEAVPLVQSDKLMNSTSACNSVIEKLNTDRKLLQDAEATGESQHIFVANFIVASGFENYKCLLEEIEGEMNITSLSFEPNKIIAEMQNQVSKLGKIVVKTQQRISLPKKENFGFSLSSLTLVEKEKRDITPAGIKRITGSVFMPNGDLALCDLETRKIIILDHEFKEKSTLKLPGKPWGIAVFSENEIVVSLPVLQILQIVEVEPNLKLKSSIHVGKKCFDVKTANESIFVACTTDPGEGEIKVFDRKGNVRKRFGLSQDGTFILNRPLHIDIRNGSDKLFVSEFDKGHIVCMATNGKQLCEFSNPEIKYPRGILVDNDGNFLFCSACNDIPAVYLVKNGETNCNRFLTKSDGIKEPYALSYRDSDRTLVVTNRSRMLVFKLTKLLENSKITVL